jgi:hypothetical protein
MALQRRFADATGSDRNAGAASQADGREFEPRRPLRLLSEAGKFANLTRYSYGLPMDAPVDAEARGDATGTHRAASDRILSSVGV